MRGHSLYFSWEGLGGLSALPQNQRVKLLNLLDALAMLPFDGDELSGAGRNEPGFARSFDNWRIVCWVDVPVFKSQVLAIESRGK